MSSTVFAKQNPSPAVSRRPPVSNEDIRTDSKRTTNRRSLSDRLRNLFRKDSSSPKRTTSNDRQSQLAPVRQSSSSPDPNNASIEAPHLRPPTVNWPFGKKKTKSPTTHTSPTSKTKTKGGRKTQKNTVPSMEISSPIYPQQDPTSIYGQGFVRRSPELVHEGTGRYQSPLNYEPATTKGFRDYTIIDQAQQSHQAIVPDVDVLTPSSYTIDHSRSPSMNRQNISNTDFAYPYQNVNSTSPLSMPLADIEVMHTPQRKRKVGDIPSLTNSQILAEKPPISPQISSRPSSIIQPSNVITNPNQWKSTSSSTLNKSGIHSTTSPSVDVDTPKLNAPVISFGSTSSKKKSKRTKSQSRADGITGSTSTINKLVQQNPLVPIGSRASTYVSLPDAEIIYGDNSTPLQPSKSKINSYPGLSAIVRHHMRPLPNYYTGPPPTTLITPPTSPQRTPRYETSTTTLNEYEQNPPWSYPSNANSAPTTSLLQRHDGYIRPMTPQKPFIQPDISVIRVGPEDLRRRSPSPVRRRSPSPVRRRSPSPVRQPSRYDSPEPPPIYSSSTTVYNRDRHQCIDGGEIRTWSSQENAINNNYNDLYTKPQLHIQVDRIYDQQIDRHENQVVPPIIKDNYNDYRYSPRAHEQVYYEQQHNIDNNDKGMQEEEESYEVRYEYERQHQQYLSGTQKYNDNLNLMNRYSKNIDGDKNLIYSNFTPAPRSPNMTERGMIYDQTSRSYTSNERIQEPIYTRAPVDYSNRIPRNYTLKRSASYSGLGMSVSADSQTRLNHIIREVEPGSPADIAGLRANDHIVGVNGINVENVDFDNVLIFIKQGLDNDNLQLSIIREADYI